VSVKKPFCLVLDPPAPPKGLEGVVVAIGNFDGIHRGHRAVLQRAKAIATATQRPCALLTFEPHPSDFFQGPGTIFRLTPLATKAALLERLGLDGMIVLSFNADLASLTAEDFVRKILVERVGVSAVVAGYDFHFGAKRTGTPAFLKEAGTRYGFAVEIIDQVLADSEGSIEAASSTATRLALEQGDVLRAKTLLGHPYSIRGEVIPGQKLGRTLDFPTANLLPDPSCKLRHGVYAVKVTVEGTSFGGVANYGRRPTIGESAPLLEVFLFDFSGDLYGKTIEVAFIDFIRGEEKFPSLEALRAQIAADAARAREILAGLPEAL
jgi:riboflavin kinase/FMN adenylyltransferase